MRFDFTHGEKAKYMVSIYRGFTNDYYYVHTMEQAKKIFNHAKEIEEKGTIVSISDMVKDVRKAFARV